MRKIQQREETRKESYPAYPEAHVNLQRRFVHGQRGTGKVSEIVIGDVRFYRKCGQPVPTQKARERNLDGLAACFFQVTTEKRCDC